MGYFEASKARSERHDKAFRDLAKELKELGCKVMATKDGFIEFICVQKDGKNINIQFQRLPYKWESYYDIDTRLNRGSSVRLKDNEYNEDAERFGLWSAKEIVEMMGEGVVRSKDYLQIL